MARIARLVYLSFAAATTAATAQAGDAAAAARRPLLVTVDDLPVAGTLHSDAAERRRITEGLLAALGRHRVPAVGFVIWSHVQGAADQSLLEQWLKAGHELGSHSDRHPSLTATDAETWIADGERARAGLDSFLSARGRKLRFFRFPFLREGDTAAKVDAVRAWLARTGQRNLTVTIDDQDWSFEEPWVAARRKGDAGAMAAVSQDYLSALRLMVRHHEGNGDRLLGRTAPQVLLLHANEVGSANWDALFSWLEETGHRFAGADEVLADAVFADLPRLPASHGFSLWDRLTAVRRDGEARQQVTRLLDEQAAAWTRGDLEAFCSVYAEDAVYLSPTGLTRGRQQVLERYRRRHPGREALGALTLEIQEMRAAWGTEVSLLGDAVPGRVQSMSVVARWTLKRPSQPDASGLTLLVLQPRGGRWEIVQDASM
ncbi:MAG TPA: polysaccharide deacetylase family protein [Vicinamibacteria bacterium]|nr:polysaccharide deacetylase family protein [Vicinamibacteria bacterium]